MTSAEACSMQLDLEEKFLLDRYGFVVSDPSCALHSVFSALRGVIELLEEDTDHLLVTKVMVGNVIARRLGI